MRQVVMKRELIRTKDVVLMDYNLKQIYKEYNVYKYIYLCKI